MCEIEYILLFPHLCVSVAADSDTNSLLTFICLQCSQNDQQSLSSNMSTHSVRLWILIKHKLKQAEWIKGNYFLFILQDVMEL